MPWLLLNAGDDDPRAALKRMLDEYELCDIDQLEDGSWFVRERVAARARANARQRRYRAKRKGDAGDASQGDAGDAHECPIFPEIAGDARATDRTIVKGGRSLDAPDVDASDASRGDARDGDAGDADTLRRLFGDVTLTDDECETGKRGLVGARDALAKRKKRTT